MKNLKKIDQEAFLNVQGIFKADDNSFVVLGDEVAVPVRWNDESDCYLVDNSSEEYLKMTEFLSQIKVNSSNNEKVVKVVNTYVTQADWSVENELEQGYIKHKPTKISSFENDCNYVTKKEIEDLDVYTKKEIDNKFITKEYASFIKTTVFDFNKTVSDLDDLDLIEANRGDIFFVQEAGSAYVKTDDGWDPMGPLINLSKLKEEIISELEEKLRGE